MCSENFLKKKKKKRTRKLGERRRRGREVVARSYEECEMGNKIIGKRIYRLGAFAFAFCGDLKCENNEVIIFSWDWWCCHVGCGVG